MIPFPAVGSEVRRSLTSHASITTFLIGIPSMVGHVFMPPVAASNVFAGSFGSLVLTSSGDAVPSCVSGSGVFGEGVAMASGVATGSPLGGGLLIALVFANGVIGALAP